MKVKFANKVFEVLYTKEVAGLTMYAVEDEPNHIDWLINVEVIDAEKKELKLLISNGGDFESNNSKQKPTWSEEDEEILKNLIDYFSLDDGLRLPTEETIDWLKSLKERLS